MPRDRAQRKMRISAAVEMRMMGSSYEEIAEILGYASKSGAWQAVNRAIDKHVETSIDLYRIDGLARLDSMQRLLWVRVNRGDVTAMRIVQSIINQRMRILGHRPYCGHELETLPIA